MTLGVALSHKLPYLCLHPEKESMDDTKTVMFQHPDNKSRDPLVEKLRQPEHVDDGIVTATLSTNY